jgi:hypothetical protein
MKQAALHILGQMSSIWDVPVSLSTLVASSPTSTPADSVPSCPLPALGGGIKDQPCVWLGSRGSGGAGRGWLCRTEGKGWEAWITCPRWHQFHPQMGLYSFPWDYGVRVFWVPFLLFLFLGFELRASILLGRCSSTKVTPPALFACYFSHKISLTFFV